MGRLIFLGDAGSHGGAEARRLFIGAAITVIAAGDVRAQTVPDCHRRETAVIAARERAAAEWPSALLPQIQLAICYDKAWRFQDVEPAILKAVAIFEAETAPAPPAATADRTPSIAGENVPVPRRTRDKQAGYPLDSLAAGVSGTVVLEIVISAKGDPREVRVAKSIAGLDKAAINAAKNWKYEPTLVGGKPADVVIYAGVRFGQAADPLPSDWLEMSAFYYGLGLRKLTRVALQSAVEKARKERDRFEGYVDTKIAASPAGLPGVTLPKVLKQVNPAYSRRAIAEHADGVVRLEALVDTAGDIGRTDIVTQQSFLDASAIHALLQWKFKPALRNGTPVAALIVVEMEFRLR